MPRTLPLRSTGGALWLSLALSTLWIRCFRLGSQSLWSDEGVTVHMVSRPLSDLFSMVSADVHPLLYYGFLHFWVGFSLSEAWLRLPSALASWFSVLLMGHFLGRVCGARVGLLTMALLGFSQFNILYAQEARAHALLGLMAMLCWYCLWRWKEEKAGGRWRLGWFALALALPHVHYLGFLMLGSQALLLLAHPRYASQRLNWLGWLAGVGLVQLPWMLWVLPRQVGFARAAGYQQSPLSLQAWLGSLYDWLFSHDFEARGFDLVSFGPAAWGLCLLALAVALLGRSPGPIQAWLWCWWLGPVAETLVLNLAGLDLSGSKYFLYTTPALFALLALGLARLERRPALAGALLAGWLLLNLVSWRNYHFNPNFGNQNWRLAGNFLRQNAGPDDLVVVQPTMMNAVLLYYLGPRQHFVGVNDPAQLQPPLQPQRYRQIWLCSVPAYRQPPLLAVLPGWKLAGHWESKKHFYPQNLVLELYTRSP